MPIEYNVSEDGLRINVIPEGVIDSSESIAYFERLKNDNRVKQGAVEYVYFKNVTNYKISFIDGEKITKMYQGAKKARKIEKTVFICETELAFGIGRMLQTLHKVANPEHNVIIVKSESELENI